MRGLLALLLLATTPGCFWFTTRHEGDVLAADLASLERRVAKQEAALDEKIRRLDESIDKATKVLRVTNANLGDEVQRLSADLAALSGAVEELKRSVAAAREGGSQQRGDADTRLAEALRRIDSLERAMKAPAAVPPPAQPPTVDKDALYEASQKKLQAGDTEGARHDLRLFVQKFPTDDRADNAQLAIGEAYFRDKDYEKAMTEYQTVIDAYKDGDAADDAFLAAALAATEKKWCGDARAYLDTMLRRFPQSPLAKTAKQKLDALKKQAKNPAVCQS